MKFNPHPHPQTIAVLLQIKERDCTDGTDETTPPLQCTDNELACQGFGQELDGVCDYSRYEKLSLIRCSGHTHFEKWLKRAKKRTGKNHAFTENVSFVEYFKHEYSENYGKRPAEGPSGFGGMYVPGNSEACIRVRDELNKIFEPPVWACTPVCLSKFNRRSRCKGLSRRNRRIRRLDNSTSPDMYVLLKHQAGGGNNSVVDVADDDAQDIAKYSLVGDGWKEGLRNRETDDDFSSDAFNNWRKRTRVVGLDYTDCDCQKWGDNHLTYGMLPDESGLPIIPSTNLTQYSTNLAQDGGVAEINAVRVGAIGSGNRVTLDDITLGGKYTFSCNPITNDPLSFVNSFNDNCMDVCHKSVKTLRTLAAIAELEENDTYNPFYWAIGFLIPIFFIGCIVFSAEVAEDGDEIGWDKETWGHIKTSFVLTCKFFDWSSDWAFYAISLQNPRFTETSEMGEHSTTAYRAGTYKHVQRASLAFCILGSLLVVAEWVAILNKDVSKELYHFRSLIGVLVIILEDIPQLTLCGLYLDSLYTETQFKLSSDPVTAISIILSSGSLLYNMYNALSNFTKGKDAGSEEQIEETKNVLKKEGVEQLEAAVKETKQKGVEETTRAVTAAKEELGFCAYDSCPTQLEKGPEKDQNAKYCKDHTCPGTPSAATLSNCKKSKSSREVLCKDCQSVKDKTEAAQKKKEEDAAKAEAAKAEKEEAEKAARAEAAKEEAKKAEKAARADRAAEARAESDQPAEDQAWAEQLAAGDYNTVEIAEQGWADKRLAAGIAKQGPGTYKCISPDGVDLRANLSQTAEGTAGDTAVTARIELDEEREATKMVDGVEGVKYLHWTDGNYSEFHEPSNPSNPFFELVADTAQDMNARNDDPGPVAWSEPAIFCEVLCKSNDSNEVLPTFNVRIIIQPETKVSSKVSRKKDVQVGKKDVPEDGEEIKSVALKHLKRRSDDEEKLEAAATKIKGINNETETFNGFSSGGIAQGGSDRDDYLVVAASEDGKGVESVSNDVFGFESDEFGQAAKHDGLEV